jgi:hypothetical protein
LYPTTTLPVNSTPQNWVLSKDIVYVYATFVCVWLVTKITAKSAGISKDAAPKFTPQLFWTLNVILVRELPASANPTYVTV